MVTIHTSSTFNHLIDKFISIYINSNLSTQNSSRSRDWYRTTTVDGNNFLNNSLDWPTSNSDDYVPGYTHETSSIRHSLCSAVTTQKHTTWYIIWSIAQPTRCTKKDLNMVSSLKNSNSLIITQHHWLPDKQYFDQTSPFHLFGITSIDTTTNNNVTTTPQKSTPGGFI